MKKYIIFFLLILIMYQSLCYGKEEYLIALPGHELGDKTFSIEAGLFIPLFFQSFEGDYSDTNLTLGGNLALQFSAYINSFLRLGLELGGALSFDPNTKILLMMTMAFQTTYVISVSRFEFPVFLGAGVNFTKYDETLDDTLILLKPGFGAFWRWDANLSFGFNVSWWWNLEFPVGEHPGMMGNFIHISPVLFYHF